MSSEVSRPFTHIHLHSVFSLLDGIIKLPELARHVKKLGMTSCNISDHGVLNGWYDWYKEAKKEGITPILGVEAYLTDNEDGIEDNKFKTRDNYHCIMIAMNEVGYKNIIYLTNMANLHNFYYRPRISIKNLLQRNEGIIATSSCLGGCVAKCGAYDSALGKFIDDKGECRKRLELFSTIFQGRFYAEIQDNPTMWQQLAYNTWLIKNAREMGIPLVITADAHFLTIEDKAVHDIVMAQQLKMSIEDYKKQGDEDGLSYGTGHYIRSPQEMYEAAIKYDAEDAFWNTTEISKQCNLTLELGKPRLPNFEITNQDDYPAFLKWQASKHECLGGKR